MDGKNGSFLMPTGLTYDSKGNLYVADGAAQRIRRIETGGAIRTIAGGGAMEKGAAWVPGSYADGVGHLARFNRPAGLAIRRDGTLFIADTFNHCIRRMLPDGTVTTYGGVPSEAAHVDGPLAVARFVRPTGLAVDNEDNLYVADFSGIRKIDVGGNVSTLPALGINPSAIAILDGPFGRMLFVGDKFGIVARRGAATDASGDRRFSSANAPAGLTALNTNSERILGNVAYLAALDEKTVAYTDVRTNTVRLLEVISGETKILAGPEAEDSSGNTGGYVNGLGKEAKFFAPLGIVRARDGSLVVADGGNRRIRRLSRIDRVDPWNAYGVAYPGVDEHSSSSEFRIAYVGNSYVWYDTYWQDSIEGIIESRVSANAFWHKEKEQPRVIPVLQLLLPQVTKFAEVAADTGLYNFVILNLNWGTVESFFNPNQDLLLEKHSAGWQQQLSKSLSDIKRELSRKNIGFLVVVHPGPFEIDPTESAWFSFVQAQKNDYSFPSEVAPDPQIGDLLNASVRRSGVDCLNLWPLFLEQETSRDRRPLFGSGNYHFTQFARRLVADAVADRLIQLAPWQHR